MRALAMGGRKVIGLHVAAFENGHLPKIAA